MASYILRLLTVAVIGYVVILPLVLWVVAQ